MFSEFIRSVKMVFILAVLLCGAYPVLVWLAGTAIFPEKTRGSLVYREGKAVGSSLIGQSFSRPEYFHGRPSVAGASGYDAASSSGSNLGPTNQKLAERLAADIDRLLKSDPTLEKGRIPVDLVTASGSGLDPHISPEAALVQVERVARARRIPADGLRKLVESRIEGPQWGLFGESTVNVLALNLELDRER